MIFDFVKWEYFDPSYVPHQAQWEKWRRLLSDQEQQAIRDYINREIDAKKGADGRIVFCTSLDIHPGKDWSGTPLSRLYEVLGCDEDLAKLFYGQWVWQVVSSRPWPQVFGIQRVELFGDRPTGLHYFTIPEPPPRVSNMD